ncbi:MAG: Maf family nucleotide pyrophosphatase [Desulfovibrio sp.]|nr:Maf family nucleotide pyrophosphatase [Desulfovibrio sp.]
MTPLFTLAPGIDLILASASPRRRRFLEEWGLPFTLFRPKGVEPPPAPGESPEHYARRAAAAKALAAADGTRARRNAGCEAHRPQKGRTLPPEALILGADTVVALDGDILGKPRDARDALDMLIRLAGHAHEVISAVCLVLPGGREKILSDTSRVFFHPWPKAVLSAYACSDEPADKAGAYAVQGMGAFLVQRIEGAFSTVVGLPLTPLAGLLLDEGLMSPAGCRGKIPS